MGKRSSLSLIIAGVVANTMGLEASPLERRFPNENAAFGFSISHLFLPFVQIRTRIRNPVEASDMELIPNRQTTGKSLSLTLTATMLPFTFSSIHSLVHPSLLLIHFLSTFRRPNAVLLSKYSIMTGSLLFPMSQSHDRKSNRTKYRMILIFFYCIDWFCFFMGTAVNCSFKFSFETL